MVEVLEILVAIDPSRHGRDIETEEGAADGAESGQRVDVGDLIHDQLMTVEQSSLLLGSEKISR